MARATAWARERAPSRARTALTYHDTVSTDRLNRRAISRSVLPSATRARTSLSRLERWMAWWAAVGCLSESEVCDCIRGSLLALPLPGPPFHRWHAARQREGLSCCCCLNRLKRKRMKEQQQQNKKGRPSVPWLARKSRCVPRVERGCVFTWCQARSRHDRRAVQSYQPGVVSGAGTCPLSPPVLIDQRASTMGWPWQTSRHGRSWPTGGPAPAACRCHRDSANRSAPRCAPKRF